MAKSVIRYNKKHFNCYQKRQLVSNIYKQYPKGFYVNDTRQAVKYIGRYIARAAIAEYRIINYDGGEVTFWHKDHDDGHKVAVTTGVLEFIGKITQHISQKGFRTLRRYGVYSRTKNKIAKEMVHLYNFMKQMSIKNLLEEKKKISEKKKTWKERIIESFGVNPILCNKYGKEKILWKIWNKEYGVIYDITGTRNMEDILYQPKESRTQVHGKNLQVSLL